MPDLSTIQGASLQPRGGRAFEALQEGIKTFQTRGLTETLAGTPTQEQEKEALIQLSTINPQVAQTVQGALNRNDRLEQEALGREIRQGLELSALLKGKDFNGKRRILSDMAQEAMANGKDPSRLLELRGKTKDELDTELQRMDIAGTAAETLLKRPAQQAALKAQQDASRATFLKGIPAEQRAAAFPELLLRAQQTGDTETINLIEQLGPLSTTQQDIIFDDIIRRVPPGKLTTISPGQIAIGPTGVPVFEAPPAAGEAPESFEPVFDAQGNVVAQRNITTGKVIQDPRVAKPAVAKAPTPQTDLAKIQADVNAGFITPAEGAAQKKTLNATPTEFKSKVGKLIGDKTAAISVFGEGSAEVKAIQAAIDGEQKGEKAKFSDVAGLRKEFTKESGDFIKVRDAINKVRNTNPDAAGDLAMIFNFMKILDPGSTVREGEFANAQNSGSVPERVWALYNQMKTGERLTPPQRKRFINQAERTFNSTLETQRQLEESFKGIAQRNNVDPRDIIVDFKPKAEAPPAEITVPPGQPEGTKFTGSRTEQGFPIFQRPDGTQFAVAP